MKRRAEHTGIHFKNEAWVQNWKQLYTLTTFASLPGEPRCFSHQLTHIVGLYLKLEITDKYNKIKIKNKISSTKFSLNVIINPQPTKNNCRLMCPLCRWHVCEMTCCSECGTQQAQQDVLRFPEGHSCLFTWLQSVILLMMRILNDLILVVVCEAWMSPCCGFDKLRPASCGATVVHKRMLGGFKGTTQIVC